MHGMLADHLFDFNQNGIAGLLPDVQSDATSPLPTAEAFYQLGMIYVAQRTVFEAQEAILDFQKMADATSDWHRPTLLSAVTRWLANILWRYRKPFSIVTGLTRRFRC